MREYSRQHKEAWEFDAYNFWKEHSGTPAERAKEVFEGEMAHARFYADEIRVKIPKCCYRKYTISES